MSDGEEESETQERVHENMGCKSTQAFSAFWQAIRIIKTRSIS